MIKFPLGRVVFTEGAVGKFSLYDIMECLFRHMTGDFGDLCQEDWKINEQALKNGGRILSSYNLPNGKLWIITEANRSMTTVMLPDEY